LINNFAFGLFWLDLAMPAQQKILMMLQKKKKKTYAAPPFSLFLNSGKNKILHDLKKDVLNVL